MKETKGTVREAGIYALRHLMAVGAALFLSLALPGTSFAAGESGKENRQLTDEVQEIAATQAYRYENEEVYAVYAPEDGEYDLQVQGSGLDGIEFKSNGSAVRIAKDSKRITVPLRRGINSVSLSCAEGEVLDQVTGIAVEGCPAYPDAGALVTYQRYEAEDGETNAAISEESRLYREYASEASGRRYVALENEGDYVTVTLTEDADALVIRTCVPDSLDGAGQTGTVKLTVNEETQDLTLTSQYSWVYGPFPWNNDPDRADEGGGHFFFDDVRVKLGKTLPAGSTVTIRKGEDFSYCLVDLIEAERTGQPVPKPENALSIEDFGAAANDGADDTAALMECIQEAGAQGKEVYLPEGEFDIGQNPYVNGIPIRKDPVVIRGAGMWHTVLKGEASGFAIQAPHVAFYDFSLIGNVKQRRDSIDPPAFNLLPASGAARVKDVRLQNVWVEHYKVGLWADVVDGISIMGCRIRNTFADGINLCGGTSHCVVTQNDLRGTGDDGIAMFNRGVLCVENKVLYNTVQLQWLANNIALYGGKDIEVSHNLLLDTVCSGGGINISTNFNPQVFEGTILVEKNRLIRCGSRENNINADYGAVWVNTIEGYDNTAKCIVRENKIEDSTYQGVSFSGGGLVENMEITDNTITSCGTYALGIDREAKGSVSFRDNTISDAPDGELLNLSEDGFTVLE